MITLHLKKKFFDQIVSGKKKVEYRADNSYYRKLFDCFYKDKEFYNMAKKIILGLFHFVHHVFYFGKKKDLLKQTIKQY